MGALKSRLLIKVTLTRYLKEKVIQKLHGKESNSKN